MNIRKLTESDYETLAQWWEAWKWPPVKKDFLPDNGTGVFVVNINVVAVVIIVVGDDHCCCFCC